MALFGMAAKQWRETHSDLAGNIRDYASIYQLIVLVNMESMNAELIKQGVIQKGSLAYLNKMAIEQMRSLMNSAAAQRLSGIRKKFPAHALCTCYVHNLRFNMRVWYASGFQSTEIVTCIIATKGSVYWNKTGQQPFPDYFYHVFMVKKRR